MKKKESNFLLYGLVTGAILSAGLVIFLSSKFIKKSNKKIRERKYKFYEGIDDIFEASEKNIDSEYLRIDKETESGIIDELFSRNK